MRIAFDLDGTLIRLETDFPLERVKYPFLAWIFSHEKLRLGTVALIKSLQDEGHEFGFKVLIVKGGDASWIDRLKAEIDNDIQL